MIPVRRCTIHTLAMLPIRQGEMLHVIQPGDE
jgi:hypothetical protein